MANSDPPPEAPDETGASPPEKETNQPLQDSSSAGSDQFTTGDIVGSTVILGRGTQVTIVQELSPVEIERQQVEAETERLAQAMADTLVGLHRQASAPPSTQVNPYKDLSPYDLADRGLFFGRGKMVQAVYASLTGAQTRSRLVVLRGNAGVGKTSLLQAGVVPALLGDGHLPLVVRVSEAPLAERIQETIFSEFRNTKKLKDDSLRSFLQRATSRLVPGKRLYLLLDQFEVFFRQPPEARRAFVQMLADCLADADPGDQWLVSIRSEWEPSLSALAEDIPQVLDHSLLLPPLSREEARQAILEPAKLSQITLEEGLAERILDDLDPLRQGLVDPSQLQKVCYTLAGGAGPPRQHISHQDYEAAGRADGVLRNYLDNELVHNFKRQERQPAWELLAALARQPQGTATAERLLQEVRDYQVSAQQARDALEVLERRRLMVVVDGLYQLASTSLLPRIQEWANQRSASQETRAEVSRQVRQVRNSALRGLFGGAAGFSLAFALTGWRPGIPPALLTFQALLRMPFGAIAGMLLVLLVDVAVTSYRGPQRWLRWLVSGAAGAIALAIALLAHYLLRQDLSLGRLALVSLEGAVWGATIGLGSLWAVSSRRPPWQTLPLSVVIGTLALGLLEPLARAFSSPVPASKVGDPAALWAVLLAGALMPALVMLSALPRRRSLEKGDND